MEMELLEVLTLPDSVVFLVARQKASLPHTGHIPVDVTLTA